MSKKSLPDEMSESLPKTSSFTLTGAQLTTWRSQFFDLPLNQLAQNICTLSDPISAARLPDPKESAGGKKHHEVPKLTKATVGGPNWICIGLDLLRLGMHKDYELSAPYLFYWHKLERCNYFLNTVVDLLARCEPLDGRPFMYLMKHAVPDAGNWQMFVNLVQKYGVIPKQCYLASWSAARPNRLNHLLKSKLHEYCSLMHAEFTFDMEVSKIRGMIEPMMKELHRVISICLGTPPLDFSWSAMDEGMQLTYTPRSFYEDQNSAPHFALEAQVCLGHDPRLSSSYQRNYRIAHSSNMINGLQQCYNNQPMAMLLQIMVASITAGSPVWLACDLHSVFYAKAEVLSTKTHNFEQLFGMPVGKDLNKAERMLYKATRRNTVRLLTKVTLDALQQPLQFYSQKNTTTKSKDSQPQQLAEEASWDAEEEDAVKSRVAAKDKPIVLTVDWLQEYGFEIVVDSRHVPPGVLHALHTQPSVELPSWDPMGALLA